MTALRPRFSIVSAVYNVEPYLPDFIASIEAQRFDLGRVEVIAVDDGSTDGSRALLEAWAARRPELVRVLSQPNGGQGSARNLGLEHATGEWVTFTDPDDMLDRDFFRVVDRFATAHPDLDVMASKPLQLEEREGEILDTHPRSAQYRGGNRTVDLDREPNVFGSATVSLYRLDRVRALDLRFDIRIRPNFEDGHFAVCYLLGLEQPRIGLLRDAHYIYRKRAAGDSSMQRSRSNPGRYTDVLRFGLLDVLERARAADGTRAEWVQHVVIYEVARYFDADDRVSSTIQIAESLLPTFHELLCQIISRIDPKVVRRHRARRLRSTWADILAHGCRGLDWRSPVTRTKTDSHMGLQRISYRYVGSQPTEAFDLHGSPIVPTFGKTMSHTFYGRVFMKERIAWVPIGDLQVRLDGEPRSVVDGWASSRRVILRSAPTTVLVEGAIRRISMAAIRVAWWPWRLAARLPPYRSTFRDAWVLMDRIYNADDNGERLFEHLRAERSDINAWFVIEAGTPEWDRLRAAHGDRVVAHGSFRWTMLMLNCAWLLSSHGAAAVAAPPHITRITGKPTWRYAFLQHGVMKDDLSKWLNNRDIEMFVVSTVAELESVIADETGYLFTSKETRNTGLPRFDRLLAMGREVAPEDRDLVIIAPTWRVWLTDMPDVLTHRRIVDQAFWSSDYLLSWLAVLASREIAAAAERRGSRIGFMPHPNMQPMLPEIELPSHVEALTFVGNDVQALYARCALLVTDYSSVAFNAAYLDRPVVYYQFDLADVMSGAHLGRKGYFEYERDGFGPVVTDTGAAVRAIVAAIEHGPSPTPEYQGRIDRTFVDRDGRACARVVAAVEELSRPCVKVDDPAMARHHV